MAFTYGALTGSELGVVVLELCLVDVHEVGVGGTVEMGETVEVGGMVDGCCKDVAAKGEGVAP